jgi:hypothetical protein
MTIRHACIGAISALAFLSWAPASWSAPLSPSAGELKAENSSIEKAAYRRCWWRRERVCRWVGHRAYDYYGDDGYYGYGPYYSYGPSFGFSFGGGGRHFHGGHHR